MHSLSTDADRLDRAVTALLTDEPAAVPPTLADQLAIARAVRTAITPIPVGAAFEDALAERLAHGPFADPGRLMTQFVRHHQRLVVTGAVSSVVLSTASAAVLAWRLVHR
jgi:hypothetical protein